MTRHNSTPPMGAASLFTAFGVLLLTVLALLSLSQAQADRRLAEKAAENTAACYAAELEAETILARLRNGETVAGVTVHDGRCTYQCPVSPYQTLEVVLEADSWRVLRWQFTAHPEAPSEALPVWTGAD